MPLENNVVARNVCIGGQWLHVSYNAEPDQIELKDNVVGGYPGFVSGLRNSVLDFRLKDDSPVYETGFRAIPVDRIGLHRDEYRRNLYGSSDPNEHWFRLSARPLTMSLAHLS
mgnify:CR=1 FL=1